MQLVSRADIRPCLVLHSIDRRLIEPSELLRGLHIEPARVITAWVRRSSAAHRRGRRTLGVDHLVGERDGSVVSRATSVNRPASIPSSTRFKPGSPSLRAGSPRWSAAPAGDRNLAVPHQVLRAGELVGNTAATRSSASMRWSGVALLAAAGAQHGERAGRVPAPARGEHWRVEHGLHQQVLRGLGLQY